MDTPILLEQALAERGNAVMIIDHPRLGENAKIRMGNAPLVRIMGWPGDRVAGLRLGELQPLVERPEDWATFIAAVRSASSLTLDLRLRVNGREVWLGFNLTFRPAADNGEVCGVLIGRDITEARERNLREAESQRLLASVFLRISAAVAIIDGDSAILMANPACHKLLGYGPGELTGAQVDAMIAAGSMEAVRAARTRQLGGAGDYSLRIELLAKTGALVPVMLHSTLLRDARDRQLRVATLVPEATQNANPGQLREVSLAAMKAACGRQWPRLAERAMLLAEQTVRQHLGPADVLRRGNDHSLLVWFDGSDQERNDAVLAAAIHEVRESLLAEAEDDERTGSDDAVSMDTGALLSGAPAPGPARVAHHWDDGPHDRNADALMQYLRAGAIAETELVTGRDGVERPIVLVDFEPSVRGCLYDLGPTLSREPDLGTGFDLMRLDLAVRALDAQTGATKVLVPISWPTLTDPDCRQEFDRRLARLGPHARSHLMLAVSAVPRLLGKQRWSETVEALQRQLAEVGLLLTCREHHLSAMQDAITSEWPLSLLVIDRTEGPPVIIDDYRSLFAAARRREIAILVRTTARQDLRDWRAMGATMFATAG